MDAMMARLGFGRYVVKTINDITEVKKLYDQIAAAAREPGDGAGHCSMLVYQYILLMHKLLIVQQENRTGTVVDNAIVFMERIIEMILVCRRWHLFVEYLPSIFVEYSMKKLA